MTPTADEIQQMPASRELDALVAERIFDWAYGHQTKYLLFMPRTQLVEGIERGAGAPVAGPWAMGRGNATAFRGPGCAHYSTDIAAAWKVIEQMGTRGHLVDLTRFYDHDDPGQATFPYLCEVWDTSNGPDRSAEADTAPLAICRACLLVALHSQ